MYRQCTAQWILDTLVFSAFRSRNRRCLALQSPLWFFQSLALSPRVTTTVPSRVALSVLVLYVNGIIKYVLSFEFASFWPDIIFYEIHPYC